MIVMQNHDFFDEEIKIVRMYEDEKSQHVREITFTEETGAIILSKTDVIELAREFGLIIYERNTNL